MAILGGNFNKKNFRQLFFEQINSSISAATMFQDMTKVSMGSILMFIYMTLILSKFGWTELRVYIWLS